MNGRPLEGSSRVAFAPGLPPVADRGQRPPNQPVRLTRHPMQPPEVYRLLSRRVRRGEIIFGVLSFVLYASSVAALVTGRGSLAFGTFPAGLLCGLALQHVRDRNASARIVSENPHLVFWAHPTVIPYHNRWLFRFTRLHFLMLHLRDGKQFEAGLSPGEMRSFVAWLTEQNPSVRMGDYDHPQSSISN